jgi:Na+-driven multidrug efflux pump
LAHAVGADGVRALAVGLPAVVLLTAVGQFARLAGDVWRSKFQRETVDRAVGDCMKYVGWGILLLAALG